MLLKIQAVHVSLSIPTALFVDVMYHIIPLTLLCFTGSTELPAFFFPYLISSSIFVDLGITPHNYPQIL